MAEGVRRGNRRGTQGSYPNIHEFGSANIRAVEPEVQEVPRFDGPGSRSATCRPDAGEQFSEQWAASRRAETAELTDGLIALSIFLPRQALPCLTPPFLPGQALP